MFGYMVDYLITLINWELEKKAVRDMDEKIWAFIMSLKCL